MKKTIFAYAAAGLLSAFVSFMPVPSVAMPAPQAAASTAQDNVAVKGYDVVAYFVDDKPEAGKTEFSAKQEGKTYLFSSAAHRDLFVKNPEAYLPQYGGACVVGVSQGHKAAVDPQSWAIVDGKLYLNSSSGAQKIFDKDRAAAIQKADENWKTLNADSGAKK